MTQRRKSQTRLQLGCFAAFAVCSALARPVHAEEDPNPQTTAAARSLAVEGLKLAKAGQCDEAIEKLERAEKLRHAPIVLGKLGECLVSVGRLVEGTEALRKMLREPVPADAAPALVQAHESAKTVLQEAKQRIPALTINVTGAKQNEVHLRVDGNDVPSTVIGVELPLDPGRHVIEVTAPGFFKATAEPRVEAGDKQTVSLELKRDPNAVLEQPKAPTQPINEGTQPLPLAANGQDGRATGSVSAPAPAPERTSNALAYVSYGVGAVGLGVGLIFGRAAMQDKDSLAARCPNQTCGKADEDALNSARTKGTISTIGFGVAAAGVALGTVWLIANSGGSEESKTATTRYLPRAPQTKLSIGLGSVKLSGEF